MEPVAAAASPQPGWYSDPFGRLAFRWWDGQRWTGYAGGPDVQWDAAPLEATPPRASGLPGLWTALTGVGVGTALGFGIAVLLRELDRPGGVALALGLTQLALWSGVLSACVLVSKRRGTGSLVRDFAWRFRPRDIGLGFAGSLVARVMAGLVLAPIPAPFFDLRAPDREVFDDVAVDAGSWVVLVVIVVIGAPLVEELFFRGLLQGRLVSRYGVGRGIVVASLVFGAAHLVAWEGSVTLLYGLSVAGAGLVLGVIRHYSGSLGAPTLAHAFFNGQAMIAIAILG